MTNKCIFKKPDGVCCEYDKQTHKGKTFRNSNFGWDDVGNCMVEPTDTVRTMCYLYEKDDLQSK